MLDVLTSPSHTQIALSTPVCGSEMSRAWYMKRQMMPAPMKEIAIGRKINDFAAFSALARSASTATARPIAVASVTTTMTHQMLLKIVPRIVDRTAQERTKKPTRIMPTDPGPRSKRWLVRRPEATPTPMPRAITTSAIHHSRLVKMSCQLVRLTEFLLVKIFL